MAYRPHDNEIFAFISVWYTITDIQTPENLQYITHVAKWNDVQNFFSVPQNSKNDY